MSEDGLAQPVDEESPQLPLRRLLALAKPEWRRLVVATVFLLVGGAASLAYPKVIGVLIDASVDGGVATINRAAVAMAIIFAVQAVAVALRYYLFSIAGERIVTRLREQVYRSIIDQEIGFFDARKTGELTSRITADATVLQNTVSVNLSMGLRNLVMVVGGLTLLVVSSPRLTALMLVLVPPVALAAVVAGRRLSKLSKRPRTPWLAPTRRPRRRSPGSALFAAFPARPQRPRDTGNGSGSPSGLAAADAGGCGFPRRHEPRRLRFGVGGAVVRRPDGDGRRPDRRRAGVLHPLHPDRRDVDDRARESVVGLRARPRRLGTGLRASRSRATGGRGRRRHSRNGRRAGRV